MDEKDLLDIIEQAAIEMNETLDLTDKGLTSLPPQIGELTQLKVLLLGSFHAGNRLVILPSEIGKLHNLIRLDVRGNQLAILPKELWQLRNLKILYLSDNQLTYLPPEIGQLTNLVELDLAKNQLSSLPPEIGRLSNLRKLILGGFAAQNQLTSLPREIGHLANLTDLVLGGNPITDLPSEIGSLHELTYLDLGGNRLGKLPPEIGQLTNLTRLIISGNKLINLPPEIGNLTKLTELGLGGFDAGNLLTELPADIGRLVNLTSLSLGGNRLTYLPDEVWNLKKLSLLDLGGNKLVNLPPGMGQLRELEVLNLSGNQLTGLPTAIGQLTKLKKLILSGNRISALPSEIGQLVNLTLLELGGSWGGNQLTSLPPQIGQLANLADLFLNRNQLTFLPLEIGQLSNLVQLDLHDNQLTFLPVEICRLPNLSRLDLGYNQLTYLPTELRNLQNLTFLDLGGNPLLLPSEVVKLNSQPREVLEYYYEQLTDSPKRLNEAKVLVVGQPTVGKTSLIKKMMFDRIDHHENATTGIDIRKWLSSLDDRQICLNMWDFAGQEILHATHEFFMTDRSLYLLVISARLSEEANRLEYWIKLIRNHTQNAPIIIVVNQSEGDTKLVLDIENLQRSYPNIKGLVETSCTTSTGIEQLIELLGAEVGKLESIAAVWQPEWFLVKHRLEEMGKDYITYSEYVRVCIQSNVDEETDQRRLLQFLHDLGVVLIFENDPMIADIIVLNPRWVTDAVYRVLTAQQLSTSRGILGQDTLDLILDQQKYPRDKQPLIIEIMKNFELCYPFEEAGSQKYLYPSLLYPRETFTGNWDNRLVFRYDYDELPISIISRFIVRLHPLVREDTLWRYGVLLAREQNEALVRADLEKRQILIWVRGREETRTTFLEIICNELSLISSGAKFRFERKVPLPDYPNVFADYDHLLGMRRRHIKTFTPESLPTEVNVDRVLRAYEPQPVLRRKQTSRGKESQIEVGMHASEPLEQVDFGIITVKEEEFDAVLRRFPNTRNIEGLRRYAISSVRSRNSKSYKVAIVRCLEQGQLEAQDVTHDLISDLDPQWLLLVGIAGGVPDDRFTLGDVVVSSRLLDFSVEAAVEGGERLFNVEGWRAHKRVQALVAHLPAMKKDFIGWDTEKSIGMPRPREDIKANKFYGDDEWKAKVRKSIDKHFGPSASRRRPIVTNAIIASSNRLVKDTTLVKQWLGAARHLRAIEMELVGVYRAAGQARREYPVLAIRGISDIVGYQRDQVWTEYASNSAAAFAHALVRAGIIKPRSKSRKVRSRGGATK